MNIVQNVTAIFDTITANAGAGREITLPTNSVITSDASASDSDGSVASVAWTETSGPSTATIANTNTLTPTFSNFVVGPYVFRLTATDNLGHTISNEKCLVVKEANIPNVPGALWAMGDNSSGMLGLGYTSKQQSPPPHTTLCTIQSPARVGSDTWSSVSGGLSNGVGIKSDGTLWTWGTNIFGELGIDYPLDHYSPIQPLPGTTWKSVAAMGHFTTTAIKSDGTLWTWGWNHDWALGRSVSSTVDSSPGTIEYRTPTQVGVATNWDSISNGDTYSIALRTDGTLWAWGLNTYGQLGFGDTTTRNTPTQIGVATDWRSIAVSPYYSAAAIKTDGTLWTWGTNYFGTLGLGDLIEHSFPTQVLPGTTWRSVTMGIWSSAAIKSDGTLWTWGMNMFGELGIGAPIVTQDYRENLHPSPTQVFPGTTWTSVSAGNFSTMATKSDGTLWGWGNNYASQLGLGDTTNRYYPTQVGSRTDWGSVSSMDNSTLAITAYPCAAATVSNCDLPLTASSNSAGGSCSSGYVGACTYSCSNGTWSQTANSCMASLSVTATASSITLPTTAFTESYSLTNGTSANTTCRLLDYASTSLTAYSSCTGSMSYTPAPTAAGTYSYSVQAYKAGTGETKTSAFTLTVNPAPPCTTQTTTNCSLTGVASGNSSAGTCASGYSGSCTYSCSNSTWSKTTNSCVTVSSFTATATTIVKGNSTKLTWATDPATACTGTGFSTGNASSNSTGVTVTPSTTSTYQINCGAAMAQTIVTVLIPTVDSFTITPVRVKSGGTVTLKWSTTNVTSCSVTKNGVLMPWSGTNTSQTDTVNTKTTYTITCDSLAPKTITVNVGPGFSEF